MLILSSIGYLFPNDTNTAFFEPVVKDKNILIVLNATLSGSNKAARVELEPNFKNITGKGKITTADLTNDNFKDILKYDVVYVTGGDLEPLTKLVNAKNKKILEKFLEDKSKTYIGESAGSMILGPNVRYAYEVKKGTKPKYDIIPENTNGFGIVQYRIIPHHNSISEAVKDKCKEYDAQNKEQLTYLKDDEHIIVDGDKIKFIELPKVNI